MQDSNTNVIQRPQMRSVDGQKATLKIGERVPIAVGTSSSTLTATALTQTQFQYQDVGVNIEMTPHIHANSDVSMKISHRSFGDRQLPDDRRIDRAGDWTTQDRP